MRPDQKRVTALLTQTISLLCRNGLQFKKELKIQGVLGITLDSEDVFIIHINNAYSGINDIDGICIDDAETLNATCTDASETDVSSKLLKSDEILRFSDSDSRRQKKEQVFGSIEPNEDQHSSQGTIKAEADDDDDLIFVKSEIADECKSETPDVEYETAQMPSTSKRKRKRLASDRQEQESLKESHFGNFDEMDFRPTDGQMYGFENTADEQNFSEHVWNDDKKPGVVDESNYFNDSNLNYSPDARWQSNIYNPQAVVEQGSEQPIVSETWKWSYSKHRQGPAKSSSSASSAPGGHTNNHQVASSSNQKIKHQMLQKTVVCQYPGCGKTFCHSFHLYRHQREKHGRRFGAVAQTSFMCQFPECGRIFYRETRLLNHTMHVHGTDYQCGLSTLSET